MNRHTWDVNCKWLSDGKLFALAIVTCDYSLVMDIGEGSAYISTDIQCI